MKNAKARTVVVVGAGFSGTAVAAQLLRQRRPVRVVLVNRYGPMGRGVAYGTSIETHLLNVPAGGMSAFPDDAEHFLSWARRRDPSVTEGSFVSRRFYGEYLEEVLADAERQAATEAALERRVARVVDVALLGEEGANVAFAEGPPLFGDRVVLALGNYSPANPAVGDERFFASPRYVRDPWVPKALDVVGKEESVLMIGTGLTMMDIALDLARRTEAALTAVSRHGLLPLPHAPGPPIQVADLPPGLRSPPRRIAQVVREVRAASKRPGAGDWRQMVASIRSVTPRLWRGLPENERARFLRHVRPYWEVHRHRAAPETATAVETLIRQGRLRVLAGRILALEENGSAALVDVRQRGAVEREPLRVQRVVNCTGPDSDVRRIHDPLLDALLARGSVLPDALRLGLQADEAGALINSSGRPSPVLFLMGPFLRARDWECTAVPELRAHAARLAARLVS